MTTSTGQRVLVACLCGLLITGGLLAWAGWSQRRGVAANPEVLVIDTPREDETARLTLRLDNHLAQTVRVVGATRRCGINGCADVEGLPLEIPPFSTRTLSITYTGGALGERSHALELFTDAPGQPRLTVRIDFRKRQAKE